MSSINPAHLSLLGATALLAGIQRTTVSLCVIMMEATGQVKILIPLIISVVVARYVADIFTEGFYHVSRHLPILNPRKSSIRLLLLLLLFLIQCFFVVINNIVLQINMELKEYPYLEHSIKESFDICTVSDVMSSPVVTLDGVEEVGHVEELLKTTKFQGFPVLDQKTRQYVGVIRRDQLVACIECGIFLETLTVDVEKNVFVQGSRTSIVKQVDANHDSNVNDSKCSQSTIFHNRNSWLEDNVIRAEDGKSILLSQATNLPNGIVDQQEAPVVEYNEDGNLVVHVSSTEERGYHLDCAAAMNMGAYTVNQNCPISKAYTLFTAMGLRHLPVLGRNGEVVGMITRSNFLPEFMEKRTGLEMH
jgi:CBS domain-containing protein